MKFEYVLRRCVAVVLNLLCRPGWGCCNRCGLKWLWAKEHVVHWKPGQGSFPLCEHCWQHTTPDERVGFYRQHFDEWANADVSWEEMKNAVLDENISKRNEQWWETYVIEPIELVDWATEGF
jgi:hypothetical protein